MRRLAQLAAATPAGRERYVDLLRALAIVLVVLGHWAVAAVGEDPAGRPTARSALPDLPWAYPVTWAFQVMPVFFLVGGYANAASLAAHRSRGGDAGGWLLARSARLLRPTTTLVLVLTGAALVAWAAGVSDTRIRTVVWFATIPLWFLAAYLLVVPLTPVMVALHRRFGLVVPPVLAALVVAGDLGRALGPAQLALGNYLFGWLAVHQLGIAWREAGRPGREAGRPGREAGRPGREAGRPGREAGRPGREAGRPGREAGRPGREAGRPGREGGSPGREGAGRRLPTSRRAGSAALLGGLAATVLLTAGPYPVSMLNVPGERLDNAAPPSLALLTLTTAQLGLILLLRGPADRWLHRDRPWRLVIAVNAVVLTVFLWHLTAAILLVGALDAAHLLPTPPVGSAAWLAWRLPWVLLLAVVLAGLVAVFGPVEARSGRRRRPVGAGRPHGDPPPGHRAPATTSAASRAERKPAASRAGRGPAAGGRRRTVRAALTVGGYLAVVCGLVINSQTPKEAAEPLGVPVPALVAYVAGAGALRLLRSGSGSRG
ncbi:acyltransferase family protein [Micromonospora sp. WMMD812]|uniref:acyltransferase family protein n=1 Tax=Micromonospora sp. WMMD812 TaxID=3015152 RepID=UPI00248B5A52|nr:acyltransferase family protein [Micromonospora sp. WMMD812]WBB67501.1 acyltransferase family protein [Micromonospora sp. WMMD812]